MIEIELFASFVVLRLLYKRESAVHQKNYKSIRRADAKLCNHREM